MRRTLVALAWALVALPCGLVAQEAAPQQAGPAAAPQLAAGTAGEQRTVLFLIDGSGSMWARFETPSEKRAKIDVVRDLVKPLVPANGAARAGIVSFGHHRRGDCKDVEVIAAPGSDHDTMTGIIDKLNPTGKGPLAEGLRQSFAAIGASRPAAIVAIGDGPDNCRQDACEAAAELAKASPGVPVHMIAIGVDPGDQPRMSCVAKETGGKFFDVRDPVGLAVAISEAGALAFGSAPAAAAASTTPAAHETKAIAGVALHATLSLAPKGAPLDRKAHWRISRDGDDATAKLFDAPEIAENLEPGTYRIEAEIDGQKASGEVAIEAGKPAATALALDAGRLKVRMAPPKDAAAAPPLVSISEAAEGSRIGRPVWIGRLDTVDIVLAPGTYTVSMTDGQSRHERQVKLALGDEVVISDLAPGSGRMQLSAVAQEGGPPLTDVTYSIFEDAPDRPDGRREVQRSAAAQPDFTLPPGTYYVVARSGYAETRQQLALSAGDTLKKAIVLQAAPLKITADVGGTPVTAAAAPAFRVTSLDGDKRLVARVNAPEFNGLINAGRYHIAVALESHAAGASQDVTVEPGKPLSVTLKIDAGEVALKPPAGFPAAVPGDIFWEIREAGGGRPVWHGSVLQPRVLLAPGRYDVRVDARDRSLQAAFEVARGQHFDLELGAR